MSIQVLFKVIEEERVENVDKIKGLCEKLVDSNMTVCPGISVEEYESYKVIRYDQKNVHITNDPFTRIASVKCLMWFPVPRNTSKQKRIASEIVCTECATLKHDLRRAAKRLSSATPATKVQHQQAESTYPMKYLSPASLKTRKMNIKCQRIKERMIKKYVPDEVILDDLQHQEMCQIQSSIEESAVDELESLFTEGEQGPNVGSILRQVWESDKRSQHAASVMSFQEDQERNSKQCVYMCMNTQILYPINKRLKHTCNFHGIDLIFV